MVKKMLKRHIKMVSLILAVMKADEDYENFNEIRILNDGGGTGSWHVAIKRNGSSIVAANFSMHSVFAEPEFLKSDEYYDTHGESTTEEFC